MKDKAPPTMHAEQSADHFSISEIFSEINAAWINDREALSDCYQNLHQAIYSTSEKICDHLGATAPPQTANTDVLMESIRKMAWSSRQYHQVISQWLIQYVEKAPCLEHDSRRQALFWIRQFIEMSAPSNCFWTNPQAVQHLIKTDGHSLVRGMLNWMADLHRGDGLVALADQSCFKVGKDLAATPGRVVFRNALLEVIQYTPQTDSVWQTPIVLITPWINKYYILDLNMRNSLVGYLVRQGYTVFITSWKNPGPEMRHTGFEDYLFMGVRQAATVAREICSAQHVHTAGYCIGGTALATLMGWQAQDVSADPICDISLFATLLDFSQPGDLAAIINPKSMKTIRNLMSAQGVLQAHHVASTFRMLNPGDLIWRYMVNNYFNGESPPKSDMLYWNSDSTRLTKAMCEFYLEAFYLDNRAVKPNALVVGGRPIDLGLVKQPLYVVGAAKDHICPWPATFQSCRLLSGKARYVLADEGHITGIVNPPSPWSKKQFRAGAATRRRDSDKWLKKQSPAKGSWWPDWLAWLKPRSGPKVPPPTMGSKQHPAMEPAPGTYVFEK